MIKRDFIGAFTGPRARPATILFRLSHDYSTSEVIEYARKLGMKYKDPWWFPDDWDKAVVELYKFFDGRESVAISSIGRHMKRFMHYPRELIREHCISSEPWRARLRSAPKASEPFDSEEELTMYRFLIRYYVDKGEALRFAPHLADRFCDGDKLKRIRIWHV